MDKHENGSSRLALVVPGLTVAALAGAICVAIFANPGIVSGYRHRVPDRALSLAQPVVGRGVSARQWSPSPCTDPSREFAAANCLIGLAPMTQQV